MTIELILPWPPTVNHYWRHVVIGRRAQVYISADGKRYRQMVGTRCKKVGSMGAARLRVAIAANPPDKRRRDLDNVLKAVLDAVTHAGVWDDDSQIDQLTIERTDAGEPGTVVLTVQTNEGESE